VEVLKSYGYRVLEAAMAGEALLLAERHPGPIHLMITDVIMPFMTGRDLAERLGPLRPEMAVLYVSGYTGDVIAHQGALDAGVSYIPKPFAPEALAVKVRELLG
jgi:DNA-binding response OmpR family regulator